MTKDVEVDFGAAGTVNVEVDIDVSVEDAFDDHSGYPEAFVKEAFEVSGASVEDILENCCSGVQEDITAWVLEQNPDWTFLDETNLSKRDELLADMLKTLWDNKDNILYTETETIIKFLTDKKHI